MTDPPGSGPYFLFFEDKSGMQAYASLDTLVGGVEGIDVKNGEYAVFSADGRVVELHASGRHDVDVTATATGEVRPDELRTRLATFLPVQGIDAALADNPREAAEVLIMDRWEARRPRWPRWLDRRLNGSAPG